MLSEVRKVEASGKRRRNADLVILRERIEPEVDSDSKRSLKTNHRIFTLSEGLRSVVYGIK